MKILNIANRLWKEEEGQDLIEYALLVALVCCCCREISSLQTQPGRLMENLLHTAPMEAWSDRLWKSGS